MRKVLQGRKSYIVAGLGVAAGIALICLHHPVEGVEVILGSLGVGALRAGIAKAEPPKTE